MPVKIHLLVGCFLFLVTAVAIAANPLFKPNIGVTDPHIKIFNNKAYLYASHDHSFESKKFVMNDWWIWSSEDLVNWKHEVTLKPEDLYIGPSDTCWATDAIERNGKYYWYLSASRTEIAAVVGDSPVGPWKDVLGKPLIAEDLVEETKERDPAVFIDNDGQAYILFGVWDFYIAKLNDDMISIAEAPKKITLIDQEGPYGKGKTDDKVDIHFYNGQYYLSWGAYYAMSDKLHGPYQTKGAFIQKEHIAEDFQNQKIDNDRHGKFFEWGGQWYFSGNDMSQPDSHGHYRNSFISYVFYRPNGEIVPIKINKEGAVYPSPFVRR